MSTQATGIPAEGDQLANSGNLDPVTGQPAQQTQPTGNPPNPNAELEQRLAAAESAATKHEQSARYFQAQNDKAQNQLRAVVGAEPKPDPLAGDVEYFTKHGIGKEQAEIVAGFVNQKISGLQQQNAQLQQTMQATQQVGSVLNAAFAGNAALFQNPAARQAAQQAIEEAAYTGQIQTMTPQYAEAVGKIAAYDAMMAGGQQQAQQPQRFVQPMQQFGMMGPQGGYTPAASQATPAPNQFDAEIKKHFGIK